MTENEGREPGAGEVATVKRQKATHMSAEEFNVPALLLLHRDIGELQGRMKAVESRMLQNEVTVQDSFKIIEAKIDRNHTEIEKKLEQRDKTIGEKLDAINLAVEAIKIDDATEKGKFRGGLTVVSIITAIGAAAGSFLTLLVNYFSGGVPPHHP